MTKYRIEAEAENEIAAKELREVIELRSNLTLTAFDPETSGNGGNTDR